MLIDQSVRKVEVVEYNALDIYLDIYIEYNRHG